MQTLQGMLAQTIHEDRVRGYADPTRQHAAAARATQPAGPTSMLRGLIVRLVARPAGTPSGTVGETASTASAEAGA